MDSRWHIYNIESCHNIMTIDIISLRNNITLHTPPQNPLSGHCVAGVCCNAASKMHACSTFLAVIFLAAKQKSYATSSGFGYGNARPFQLRACFICLFFC